MLRVTLRRARVLALICFLLLGAVPPGEAAPNRPDTVTLAAVGDVLLARGVGKQIGRGGLDRLLSPTRGALRGADLAFCNLECALSTRGVIQRLRFRFRADPELARALHRNGFDVASLANNHTLDYGRVAMLDTRKAVEAAGMLPVGVGLDRRDAIRVRVVKKNGLRIGFVAYTDVATPGVVRLEEQPTTAGVNEETLAGEIRRAKSACDVLVVSFHWGREYMKQPTERQRFLAHLCIDYGADLILGHHPHVLQPAEIYRGRPILYSLGGFLWDSRLFGADKSAIYLLELGKSSARIVRKVPVEVRSCRPALRRHR